MPAVAWPELLTQWSAELLRDDTFLAQHADTMSPEARASGWVGYPAATQKEIAGLEHRLGVLLPPSYRAFLAVSNGWRQTSPFIYRLWSTEEVEWFAVRHQDWINAYAEAFEEGDEWIAHLQSGLEISDRGDAAVYLLNQHIMTPAGEWEAWFFAAWADKQSYPSFWELMVAELERYLRLRHTEAE